MNRNRKRVSAESCKGVSARSRGLAGAAIMVSLLACAIGAGCSERTYTPTRTSDRTSNTEATGNTEAASHSAATSDSAANPTEQRGASTVTNVTNGSSPTPPSPATPTPANFKPGTEQALFGAGCFWGVEHIYRTQIPGVLDAVSGYAGGRTRNPTYQDVCSGSTGHVEVVLVTFDPAKTNYDAIVDAFFRMHDPTQVNRQGPDIGEQYRSVIYYYTPEQRTIAEAVKARRQPRHSKPIATTVEPAPEFYKAEEYHQKYYIRKGTLPYCHTLRED